MNVVLLNGDEVKNEDTLCRRIRDVFIKAVGDRGDTITVYDLADLDIKPCLGCFGCWQKTPGLCVHKDVQEDILRSVVACDLIIYLTPVTFGGYSSQLKKAVDRLIPIVLPFFIRVDGEVHHVQRYRKKHRLAGVGTLPRTDPDSEELFRRVLKRNAINFDAPDPLSLFVTDETDTAELEEKVIRLLSTGVVQ